LSLASNDRGAGSGGSEDPPLQPARAEMAEAGFGPRRSHDPGAARVRYTLSARDVLM